MFTSHLRASFSVVHWITSYAGNTVLTSISVYSNILVYFMTDFYIFVIFSKFFNFIV